MSNLLTKQCTKCMQTKSLSLFGRHSRRGTRDSWCKACRREKSLATHRADRIVGIDRARRNRLKKKFGLSVEQYESLLLSQGGVCAICREPCSSGNRLAVDHDHTTGKVRGLLCAQCNQALGKLQESPALLRAAVTYLEAA